MNKNLAVFALVMLVMGTLATYSAPQVFADWIIDRSGTFMQLDPMVLGDEDEQTEASKTPKPESKTENSNFRREESSKLMEIKRESAKKEVERAREMAKKTLEKKTKLNELKNKHTETNFELSARGGELKVKERSRDEGESEKEIEHKLEVNEALHIEKEDGEKFEVEASRSGELEIRKNEFKSRTRLPISVNSDNELTVTRPDGSTKVVTVLPDEAVSKMLEQGTLVESKNVELTTDEEGEPVYQVKQEVTKKFLGLIKMKFNEETNVSANDSSEVSTSSVETSPWRRFLERLSTK